MIFLKNEKTKGVFIALLAIFLFSSKAIIIKYLYRFEVVAIHMLLLRMFFAMPFYVMMLQWYRKKNRVVRLSLQDKYGVVFFGIMGYYVASIFDFYGLQYLSASLERIILFIYPTLVLLLSALFLKTKITQKQVVAIILTYVGVVLTVGVALQTALQTHIWLGVVFIFISALTYAGYLVGSGWLVPKLGITYFTSLVMIVACFSVMLHYLVTDRGNFWSYSTAVYGWIFLMSIFCTVLPSYLVSAAISRLGSSNFSIIGSVGPVFTIVLASVFIGEQLTLLQFFGVAIVIFGVRFAVKK